jgi:hypothetical protein
MEINEKTNPQEAEQQQTCSIQLEKVKVKVLIHSVGLFENIMMD